MTDSPSNQSASSSAVLLICIAMCGAPACGDISLPADGSDAAAPVRDAAAPIDAAGDASALDPNLIARYSFDTLSGAAFRDESGNGHDTACVDACPTVSAGVFGNAVNFSGAPFLRIADDGSFTTTQGVTVSVWLNIRSLPVETRAAVVGKPVGETFANSWQLVIEPDGRPSFFSGTSDDVVDFQTIEQPLPLGTYVHVALSWDGATKRIYIDGERVGDERAADMAFSSDPILIGADLDGESRVAPFDGQVDELRIYRRALSSAAIAALAAAPGL